MKKMDGFVQILFVVLLPVLLGLLVITLTILQHLKMDQRMQFICTNSQLIVLNYVADQVNILISLNPKAIILRKKRVLAEKAYQQALISQNPYLITAAFASLQVIKSSQMSLDLRQKHLIKSSQMKIEKYYHQIIVNIKEVFNSEIQVVSTISQMNWLGVNGKKSRLLLVRDSPDIAPVYRTSALFEEDVRMAHFWKFSLKTTKPLEAFLRTNITFKKECQSTLYKKGDLWKVKTLRGKSLSSSYM